jgi:hypothetical protein
VVSEVSLLVLMHSTIQCSCPISSVGGGFLALAQSGRGKVFSRGSLDFDEGGLSVPIYPSLKACRTGLDFSLFVERIDL